MLTQCPHCSATFRVNDEQLAAAHGKVRCGACMKVFNARESLLNVPVVERSDKNPLSMPASASPSRPAGPVEPLRKKAEHGSTPHPQGSNLDGSTNLFVKAFEKNKPASDGRDLLFQDNPEEDQIESGYSGSLVTDSLLTDSFRELGGSESERKLFNHAAEESDSLAADESWAESMLNDLDKPNPSPFPPDNHQSAFTMAGEENLDGGIPQNRRQNLSNPLQDDFALRADPKPGFGHYAAAPIRVPSTPAQASHRTASKLLLAFLIIVLLVILFAQLGLYHFDRLAREEWIRPVYTYLCDALKPLGCELPKLTDINKVRSEDLVVRSHPLVADALIIDAVLVNDASFEQPFPAISLSFSDINNNVVAQRVFLPAEYLSGEARLNKLMPAKTPVPVSLELKDPGKLAVNYTIRLREAPSESADSGS